MFDIENGEPGKECAFCGKDFKRRNSVRGRQVVWGRWTLRIANQLFRVHGSVCAQCRDNRIAPFLVSQLAE